MNKVYWGVGVFCTLLTFFCVSKLYYKIFSDVQLSEKHVEKTQQNVDGRSNIVVHGSDNSINMQPVEDAEASSDKKTSITKSDFKIPAILLERTGLIKKIENKLSASKGINTVALIGVVGNGGAGKTVLARLFGKFCKYPIVWELNAERKESLIASFQDLARALAITNKQKKELGIINSIEDIKEKERQVMSRVKVWLKEKGDWLLIYDNIENIATVADYFPQDPEVWGNGKVIITTRDSNIGNTEYLTQESVIQVEELNDDEKLALFSKIFYDKLPVELIMEQKLSAVDFLKITPSFPLDVSVAAYYLKVTGTSFQNYLKNLDSNDVDFQRVQSVLLEEMGGYTKTRYNIIITSLKHLIYSNKDFKDLVLFISLFDSQNIPRELLNKYKADTVVDEFILNLKKYSLITHDASSVFSGPSFSIHRSTQAIILAYIIQNLGLDQNKKILEPITNVLDEYISSLLDKEDTTRMKSILVHCEAFLKHKALLTDEFEINIKASLAGMYHYISYDTQKAAEIFEDSLAKLRQYNNKDILKARTMTYLGDLYRKEGSYDKAEKLLQESCIIYSKNSKRTVSEAYTLASLGLFYQSTSNYQKAKEFLERSIAIYKSYPESKIGMARVLAYIGLTYADLGLYRKAINAMEESQRIYKENPETHFRLCWVLMYIGDIYRKLGVYNKAIQALEESLEMHKKYDYGEKSIDRLRALSYLGIIYGELGDYKQAIDYIERQSLALYIEYHPKSFDRIWATAHLTEIYRKLGDYQKAQILIEDSVVIHSNNIANRSANIRAAWLLAKLGCVHNDLGNHMEAWKLLTKNLNVYQSHFGNDTIKTAKILFRLGEVYKNLGQHAEAIKAFEGCLVQYRKNYGESHIRTAQLISCLANEHLMNNNLVLASILLNKALNIFKATEHYAAYIALEGLGDLLRKRAEELKSDGDIKQSQGLINQAVDNYKQAIERLKTALLDNNSTHLLRLRTKLKETAGVCVDNNSLH